MRSGTCPSRARGHEFLGICESPSADPSLAVPVRAQTPTPREVELERLGLDETRRREHLETFGRVNELEVAIGALGRSIQDVGMAAAKADRVRPDVDRAPARLDVVSNHRTGDNPHAFKFRVARMRNRARAIVIGGGVGGCSVLYWLTRLGWDDVVLIERAELTSGSTFHSAGLVGQLRSSLSLTRMMMESVDLYRTLGVEVGLETGWHEVGSLRLASSEERMEEIARQAGWAKTFGLPLELISPAEAQELFPPMTAEGVLGAAFLPTDGYIDPSQLTFALAEGARRRGAEIAQRTRVTGIRTHRGRVAAVVTDGGDLETEIVVDAGGVFATEIGALAGVNVPIVSMAHEYLVTKPAGLPTDMPTMRDPSLLVYFRPESGGIVMGGYERQCAPWGLDGIPADFNSRLLEEDWPRFEELMENAVVRVPSLAEMQVVRLVNGPEAFTPDGEFILGPSDVRGFWVAAGFCAHGLAGAGGMGKLVAEWIVEGTPSLDVWHMDSRRFGAAYRSREYTLARTKEIYETYYDVKYPGHERSAGRPLRVSPAYARLGELGAVFGEKSGWERVNWFEPNAGRGDESLRPRGWAGKLWSPAIGVEHAACRETAALFDETSFAKLDISGDGAADFLEGLCDNHVARQVGHVAYTQMLNARGGIECDFTVTRLAEERFRIVTGTAFGQHDLAWLRQHAPDDGSVHVADVTSQLACYGIWGPSSRGILQPLTTADLSNEAFPYMWACELAIDHVPCLALRVTYVGELGWELYCPAEFGLALWDTLWEAGRDHGMVAGGYKAIDSLRLEKGYRVWGADITPEDTPFEAGLGFAVKLDKGNFIGREALASLSEPTRSLRCLALQDPRAIALGSEPVQVDGELVGRVTSGGYGYTVGKSIAYAYLPAEHAVGTEVAVEIFGDWVQGTVAREPLFDPKGERIRS
jgi:glycine cleavage system aminomethyltransferase T/glycine/D-amino acid oxidase-like deaminating enzyme